MTEEIEIIVPSKLKSHKNIRSVTVSHNHHEISGLGFFHCLFSLDPPKFPKERLDTVVVKEGEPFTLHCNPPEGVAPRQIYWMTIGKPSCSCLLL